MTLLNLLLFSFALLTDIHISPEYRNPEQDLIRSIDEIRTQNSVDFVIVTGDIADCGDKASMQVVKHQLDRLTVPYYIINGNHETTWTESGNTAFVEVFGDTHFTFTYNNIFFFGFNTGPLLKMADGHVMPQDIIWMKNQLDAIPQGQKAIAFTHYPLRDGDVDNWYDVTDVLRQYNLQCIIGGHYHRNMALDCDGIGDFLCRSNLRDADGNNGYTIVDVAKDSIRFYEKKIGVAPRQWAATCFADKHYPAPVDSLRPSFAVNDAYPDVYATWRRRLPAAVFASPQVSGKRVLLGDDEGVFYCMDIQTGDTKWTFRAGARIFGTAAVEKNRVVFGSCDHYIYCLDTRDGHLIWKKETPAVVLGSPVINKGVAYIAGSSGQMFALNMQDGREVWTYDGLKAYCSSRPTIYRDKIYFGAWDCNFYALNLKDGSLAWKWNNGKTSDKLSPAAVWPVITKNKVYIAAPDRYMTCLNAQNGEVVWRTNRYKVRETAALNEAETMVYSKCMWDTVVAFSTKSNVVDTVWVSHAGFGYDHVPCMPLEKDGTVYIGTRNGNILGLDARNGHVLWRHKIGNSMIQTVYPLNGKECLITSTDGTVMRLKADVKK